MDTCLVRAMTFIRGSFHDRDEPNAWKNRASPNVRTIKRHAPDLIGFEELQDGNLDTYRKSLARYGYVLLLNENMQQEEETAQTAEQRAHELLRKAQQTREQEEGLIEKAKEKLTGG